MKLEKEQILASAFTLLNEVGLEKFNMRALANNLEVSATAIYWHYKNKNELIEAMVGEIYANAYLATRNCKRWQSHLITLGNALKSELELNRDSIRLIASRVPEETENLGKTRFNIAKNMAADGLDTEQAWQFVSITISFVLGWMSYYQNEKYRTYLSSQFDFEGSFDLGIESLVMGFEQIAGRETSVATRSVG